MKVDKLWGQKLSESHILVLNNVCESIYCELLFMWVFFFFSILSMARKTGVLRHFLGHNLFEENTYDIITYGGLGRVSSLGLDGTIHWQVTVLLCLPLHGY